MVLCLIADSGHVVGVDRYSGEVLWRHTSPINLVTHAIANDQTLVLAGLSSKGGNERASNGLASVLDTATGKPRLPEIKEKRKVSLLDFAGPDLVLVATSRRLSAYGIGDGKPSWRTPLKGLSFNGFGMGGGKIVLLALSDALGSVLALEATSGRVASRITLEPWRHGYPTLDVVEVDGGWHLLTPRVATALDQHGEVRWRDAINPEQTAGRVLQVAGKDLLAVVGLNEGPITEVPGEIGQMIRRDPQLVRHLQEMPVSPDATGGWRYTVYFLDRTGGRILSEVPIGPLPSPIDPRTATFVRNHLVLTTGTQTIVLPSGQPVP